MGGIGTAIIASAVIGAGSSKYAADKQEKAAKEDRDRRAAEAADAKAEADRIAREARPDELGLSETKFGTSDANDTTGSSSDFLVPKQNSLGGSGRSGLGFKV